MVFTRNLRPRVRKLPLPPSTISEYSENVSEPDNNNIIVDSNRLSNVVSNTFGQGTEKVFEEKILNNLEASFSERKNVLEELGDVIKEGLDKNLIKAEYENVHENLDYSRIKKSQYSRAVDDYKAAGKTFSDSGLYSNASISYACAILAKLLASESIQEAYNEFQGIIEIINDKQIIRSSLFSILTLMFEAIAKKDYRLLDKQLEKLNLIETFSIDDHELILESIQFLTKKR